MGTISLYLCILAFLILDKSYGAEYTNQFAIHVEPDVDVDELAFKYGLVNKGQVRVICSLFYFI